PTDCPQRDERLGYTGDAEVFCRTACYQGDCRVFYDKYLKDMAIDQAILNGGIASYSPSFKECEESGSVWSDAATIIPWTLYTFYGDKYVLEKHFPMMQRYVDTLIERDETNGGARLYNFGFHLGDWLSQDGVDSSALRAETSEYFIASCFYCNSINIVSKACEILGYKDKFEYYKRIYNEIKQSIFDEYFTPNGRLAVDTQTAYVTCAMFDIYPNKEKLVKGFSRRIQKDCYKIRGGFVGATKLVQMLIECGLVEDAFKMLYSEDFPSWLYCVNLGATTIWERWNSLNPDGSVSSISMNSLNHYSFGAVAEALYGYISGIKQIGVAFKNVVIEPKFNFRLKKFDYKYYSVAGEYAVRYKMLESGMVELSVKIPYGVKAKLVLDCYEKDLDFGETKVIFNPKGNLIYPFSVDMKVCDMLSNEKCSAVLKKYAPSLHYYLSNNNVGLEGRSFRTLCSLRSFAISNKAFESIDAELKKIKYTL
ncbi:MAG: hypothetical protein IKZ28_02080, partial [Clostridia bacterium]|nr:hypothetical protein [Clostridia bacterium]